MPYYVQRSLLRSELKELLEKFGDDFNSCAKPLMGLCRKGEPVEIVMIEKGEEFSLASFEGEEFNLNNNYISTIRC